MVLLCRRTRTGKVFLQCASVRDYDSLPYDQNPTQAKDNQSEKI